MSKNQYGDSNAQKLILTSMTDMSRPASSKSNEDFDLKKKPLFQSKSKDEALKANEKNKKHPFKMLLSFLVSYFGMVALVIVYACGGAYLFQILEQQNEIQNCQLGEGEWNNLRIDYRTDLFNYIYFNTTPNPWLPVDNSTIIPSLNYPKDGPAQYNPILMQKLTDLRKEILYIYNNYTYSGQDCESQSLWTYLSALLFTVNTIAVIGYGHVTPKTWEGQIVCVCYTTLGIPLYLMSLAKISFILGDMFRYIYSQLICTSCYINSKRSDKDKILKTQDINSEEKENGSDNNRDNKQTNFKQIEDDKIELNADEEELAKRKINVPLFLVFCILAGYLVLGGYVFTLLEDLTWVQSIYFCYVSLATIGFGDIVPGIKFLQKGNSSIGGRNLFIAIVYIFFGMAILAMCYDLMQEEMVEKVRVIGIKLGIINEFDEDDESVAKNQLDKSACLETIDEDEKYNDKIETNKSKEATRINVKAAKDEQEVPECVEENDCNTSNFHNQKISKIGSYKN